MKKLAPALILLATLAACSQPASDNSVKVDSATKPPVDTASRAAVATPAPVVNEFTTKSGKTWIVTETKTSASQSDLQITSKGFTASNNTMTIEGTDPVEKVLQADLNKDGFEEIYIITRSAGSGSGAIVHGFSSNRDKSFSSIHVQEVTDKDVAKGGKFEGYLGHDSIFVQGNLLARQFPVYKEGDANAAPTGGKRTVFYALKPGEAAWQLEVASSAQAK